MSETKEENDTKDPEEQKQKPDHMTTLKKLSGLNGTIRYNFWKSCIFGLINGICFPGFAVGFKYALDWLGEVEYEQGDGKGDMPETALKILYLFLGIGTILGTFTFLQIWSFHRLGTMISCEMRRIYYQALLAMDIAFHDAQTSAKLNAKLGSDATLVNVGMGTQFGLTCQHFGEFLGGFGYAFYVSWRVTVIMLALMPVLIFVGVVQGKVASSTTSGSGEDEYEDALGESGETLAGLRTVKSMNAEGLKLGRFSDAVNKTENNAFYTAMVNGLGMGGFLFAMFGIIYGVSLMWGAFQVDRGNITTGDLFGAFFGVMIGGMGIGQAGASWPDIEKGLFAAHRMFKIIDRKPEIKPPSNGPGTGLTTGIEGNIEIRDLEFAYPTRPDLKIYDGLNLTIKAGQTVAFVGPTGCGKSTIVNLLERFYDPLGGSILLDGKEIHEFDITYLRDQVSLVSQEPILFVGSIKENIQLGTNTKLSDAKLEEAAKKANAWEFICKENEKMDTQVGEKGSQLSGGQKQRIAIARAIVKRSKIILLDEATSALDTESEKVVQGAIDRMIEDQHATCIVIAHRLSTIRNADVIVVLDGGKIQEMGTHDDLVASNGIYTRMVETQNLVAKNADGDVDIKALRTRSHSMSQGVDMVQKGLIPPDMITSLSRPADEDDEAGEPNGV